MGDRGFAKAFKRVSSGKRFHRLDPEIRDEVENESLPILVNQQVPPGGSAFGDRSASLGSFHDVGLGSFRYSDERSRNLGFEPVRGNSVSSTSSHVSEDNLKNIREVFETLDTDGSGSIDRAEARNFSEVVGIILSEEEFEGVFDSMDTNGDGNVSFEELVAWMNDFRSVSLNDEIMTYFEDLADQRIGKISIISLGKVRDKLGLNLSDDLLQEMIDFADPDADGEIDRKEFMEVAKKTSLFKT